MTLFKNISSLVTVDAAGAPYKTGDQLREIGEIADGAVLFDDTIRWVGPTAEVPQEMVSDDTEVIDCAGQTVLPGWVDAHTHMVSNLCQNGAPDRAT